MHSQPETSLAPQKIKKIIPAERIELMHSLSNSAPLTQPPAARPLLFLIMHEINILLTHLVIFLEISLGA
jgi:hypothetical protein